MQRRHWGCQGNVHILPIYNCPACMPLSRLSTELTIVASSRAASGCTQGLPPGQCSRPLPQAQAHKLRHAQHLHHVSTPHGGYQQRTIIVRHGLSASAKVLQAPHMDLRGRGSVMSGGKSINEPDMRREL